MIKTRSAKQNPPENSTATPARIDPISGKPLPPRGKKFKNQPCEDAEGNRYASLAERRIALAFKDAADAGKCTKPTRGKYAFVYERDDGEKVKIGSYTSDLEFTALKDFAIETAADRYEFKAGQRYVVDVKSAPTDTIATRLRFRLMLAFHKIEVTRLYTSRPKPRRPKARK